MTNQIPEYTDLILSGTSFRYWTFYDLKFKCQKVFHIWSLIPLWSQSMFTLKLKEHKPQSCSPTFPSCTRCLRQTRLIIINFVESRPPFPQAFLMNHVVLVTHSYLLESVTSSATVRGLNEPQSCCPIFPCGNQTNLVSLIHLKVIIIIIITILLLII